MWCQIRILNTKDRAGVFPPVWSMNTHCMTDRCKSRGTEIFIQNGHSYVFYLSFKVIRQWHSNQWQLKWWLYISMTNVSHWWHSLCTTLPMNCWKDVNLGHLQISISDSYRYRSLTLTDIHHWHLHIFISDTYRLPPVILTDTSENVTHGNLEECISETYRYPSVTLADIH
jgi:hypothetical protein